MRRMFEFKCTTCGATLELNTRDDDGVICGQRENGILCGGKLKRLYNFGGFIIK